MRRVEAYSNKNLRRSVNFQGDFAGRMGRKKHEIKSKLYSDFFMATSEDDITKRLAKSIYTVLHLCDSLLKKGVRYLKIFKTFRPVFKPSP